MSRCFKYIFPAKFSCPSLGLAAGELTALRPATSATVLLSECPLQQRLLAGIDMNSCGLYLALLPCSLLYHFNVLGTVGIDDEVTFVGCVLAPALTSCYVPCVTDHEFEVVIIVNAGTHITVIVAELFDGDAIILLKCIPLAHELEQDLVFGHSTRLEHRVE